MTAAEQTAEPARPRWTLFVGWALVVGTFGWLFSRTALSLYAPREPTEDAGGRRPGEVPEDETRDLVLRALEQAASGLEKGEKLSAQQILDAYRELYDDSGVKNSLRGLPPPAIDAFREMLKRYVMDGYVRKTPRKGYALTPEGKKVLGKPRRSDS